MTDHEYEQCIMSSGAYAAGKLLRPIDKAPKDGTRILLLTSDFGWVEGWWDVGVPNYYKSIKGSASYDPDNAQGDWVSHWQVGDDPDRRLYCGLTPHFWIPVPAMPEGFEL